MSSSLASKNDQEELLLSCRYGDLDDVKDFVQNFGIESVSLARDENANTALHMSAGNGHTETIRYLLAIVDPSLISAQNDAGSTALHWAALNSHMSTMQALVEFESGSGVSLIDIKNKFGRSPLAEAELAGWDEGAKWLVEKMNLNTEGMEEGDVVEDGDTASSTKDIEVEIKDAEGSMAKMTIPRNR